MDVFAKYKINPSAWYLTKAVIQIDPSFSGGSVEVNDAYRVDVSKEAYRFTLTRKIASSSEDPFHIELEYENKGPLQCEYSDQIEKDITDVRPVLFYKPSAYASLLIAQATAQMGGSVPLIVPMLSDNA